LPTDNPATASSPTPEASVIIAYYKEPDLLARQLRALSLQENAPRFEVIIADNEGSSILPDVVRPFHNELDVHTIDASDRSGQDHARNQGVAAARGTLIALCDQDDIVSPSWLAALVAPLRESDVLATGPLRLDRINSRISWLTGQGLDASADPPSPVLSVPVIYLDYLPAAVGCNIGMRRSTFLALGGFDETLPGDEDSDLTWRCIENGIPLQVEPAAIVDYRLRSTAREVFHQRRTYMIYQTAFWVRSKSLGRPIRGMSFRWTITETLRLAPASLQSLLKGPDEQYAFAAHAGNILGNLEGQLKYRVIPATRNRLLEFRQSRRSR
jgi:GT2 family glycosyltransferase